MWVFEDNSFVPCAKIKNGKTYSIITDHLGTPTQMYNDEGESVWEQELDMYGKVRKFANKDYVHLPFRYQGQYYDSEIDLCYNRFRYYDPEIGRYISEDPIGFFSGEYNFYNYVNDPNVWLDIFGLAGYNATQKKQIEDLRNGIDVNVKNIDEARALLKHMPELRPHIDKFPANSGMLFKGTNFADVWKQPNGTFRGDLVNTSKQNFEKFVHDPKTVTKSPKHAMNPHYNIRFGDGTKSAIIIG